MPFLSKAILVCLLAAFATTAARSQSVNPVYIDDSPRAAELLIRARLQLRDNPGEAVRLLQEILDEYALKLVPAADGERERFTGVRRLVLDALRSEADVLERYRNMESTEADRLLKARKLELVARTRSLTRPGLDALLLLAQEALEEGRFYSALHWLDESARHPDLEGDHLLHALLIEGMAAHHVGRNDRADLAQRHLAAHGEPARRFLEYLEVQRMSDRFPAPTAGTTVYDTAITEELDQLVAQAIWSAELVLPASESEGPSVPGRDSMRIRQRIRPPGFDAPGATATVTDDVIYVSEGTTIRALNRFTARPIWHEPFRDPDPTFGDLRGEESPGDLSVAAVSGHTLVALSGQSELAGMMNHGAVVCLDAGTGRLRWKRTFGSSTSAMPEGLFPHGQPVIFEGAVYILARQVTPERLTGTYVVSLDLRSGALRWTRFIASSGNRSSLARPLSSLKLHDGRLLIATPIGAAAVMHPESGEFLWLRRESVPAAFRETSGRIFEVNVPVVINGMVYVLSADRRDVLAIDVHHGLLHDRINAGARDGWNNPTYLLGDDSRLYAIGSDVRAFDPNHADRPLWILPDPSLQEDDSDSTPTRLPLSGRVQVASGTLLVPTRNGLMVVDAAEGRTVRLLETDGAGHPVASGAQLLMATANRIGSYMSIDRADTMLRERIADDDRDPQPAISLARLGLRIGSLPLLLEASDLGLKAAARSGEERSTRDDIFAILLEMHQAWTGPPKEAEAIYALMNETALSASQRVEFLLAHAAWLSKHRPEAAAEQFRQVLSDPQLSSVQRDEADVLRPATSWATQGLDALVEQHGEGVRSAYDRDAQTLLERARSLGDDDALLAVARSFPASPAAIEAAILASENVRARGRFDLADGILISAIHRRGNLPGTRRLITELVARADADEVRPALFPPLASLTGSLPIDLGGETLPLRAHALVKNPGIAGPTIGSPSAPIQVLAGRLVTGAAHHSESTRAHPILLLDDHRIRAHDTETLDPIWDAPLTDPDVQFLTSHLRRTVLFSPGRSNDPRFGDDPALICIDEATGDTHWRTEAIDRLFNLPLLRSRQVQELMPNQLPFDPSDVIVTASGPRAFLVRRSGHALAFDIAGDGEPLWSASREIDQVHHAFATFAGLVMIGRDQSAANAPLRGAPIIVLLDSETGQIRSRLPLYSRIGATWARIDALGRLLVASSEGWELIDLHTGERLWMNRSPVLQESRTGWLGGATAVAEDRTGRLHLIDLLSGRIIRPLEPSGAGNWELSQVESVHPALDGTWLVRYAARVVRYDPSGMIIGADVIGDARNYVGIVVGADTLIILSLFNNSQVRLPGEDRLRMQRTYRLYPLALDGRMREQIFELPPMLKRLQAYTAVNGWLLLSTDAETIVIPAVPTGQPPNRRAGIPTRIRG